MAGWAGDPSPLLDRAASQPPNLPAMVYLMAYDMKPFEVVVHPLSASKRRLLFQPPIIALREFGERLRTHLLEGAQVVFEPVSSRRLSGAVAKFDHGAPPLPLVGVQVAHIEGRGLVADLRGCDMREEHADGVALRIVHVV